MNTYSDDSGYYDHDSYAGESSNQTLLSEDYDDKALDFENHYFKEPVDSGFIDNEEDAWLINTEDELEGFRALFNNRYQNASLDQLDRSLSAVYDSMTPAEEFNFGSALKKIGSAGKSVIKSPIVSKIGATALPIAGAAAGTFIGGPAGTAIGGQLGQVAGGAMFGSKTPAGKIQGGSAPAAQLLQLTQSPSVLNALGSLAMGSIGNQAIPVGPSGNTIDPGAIMNMIVALAQQASADAEEMIGNSYLSHSENASEDLIVPEVRARALYETLMDAENESFYMS
jgi:hypothetical protein